MERLRTIKMKVTTSILAMLMILATFNNPVSASSTFTDIETFPWAVGAIDYLVYRGVIEGVGNNKFNPMEGLTRGEAAKIIALSTNLEVDMNERTAFVDAKSHWSSPYIHALQTQTSKIINGFPDGTFKPNSLITREQMAKMIVLAYNLEKNESADIYFDDVSGWAGDYIYLLASKGIVEGTSPNTFSPNEIVNRAQATVFIYRTEIPLTRGILYPAKN